MPFDTKTVPFEIPTVNQGFRIAKGLLKLVGEELEFEFQVTDAFLEIISSDVKEVRIKLEELQSIEYRKRWIGAKILIEAKSLRVFDDIPGTEQAECVLHIKRKDRQDAERLVSKIRLVMSEMKLKDLGD